MKIQVNGIAFREKPAGNSKKGDILNGEFDVLDTAIKQSGTWYKIGEAMYVPNNSGVVILEDETPESSNSQENEIETSDNIEAAEVNDVIENNNANISIPDLNIKVGSRMYFTGGMRYSCSDRDSGSNAKAGMVTVLNVDSRSKHPVQVHRSNTVPSLIKGGYIGYVDTSSLRSI